MTRWSALASLAGLAICSLSGCSAGDAVAKAKDLPFAVEEQARFDEAWAMTFLPDGRALVTEKKGRLLIWSAKGKDAQVVSGVPKVAYGGQGGFSNGARGMDPAAGGGAGNGYDAGPSNVLRLRGLPFSAQKEDIVRWFEDCQITPLLPDK